MIFDILLISLVTLLVWYRIFTWNRKHLYEAAAKIPGPKELPFIGNAGLFMNVKNIDSIKFLTDFFSSFPDIGKLWLGPILLFGISKPELIDSVLNHKGSLEKIFTYKFLRSMVGSGMLTADVPTWSRHRKLILPAFNQKNVQSFVHKFHQHFTRLQVQLEQFVDKEEFNIFPHLNHTNLLLTCDSLMDVKLDANQIPLNIYEGIREFSAIHFSRVSKIWNYSDFLFQFSNDYKRCEQIKKQFHDLAEELIKRKKEQGTDKKALLDLLIHSNRLPHQEIVDETVTFLVAGSDTTGNTGSFLFLLLAIYPEVQEKMFEEILQVLGAKTEVDAADLALLEYTERVIKETMRLFPIIPVIGRTITENITLPNGMTLPAGSSAFISLESVHRNPEYWPDPLKFDPDRFLPEEIAKRHRYSFLPFSHGLRPCPGNKYAMFSMKTMACVLLRKFRFSTSYKSISDVKLKYNLFLDCEDGHKVSISRR